MTRIERAFCVVQFIELPFEGIDDYVCVPRAWLIVRRARDQKAVVAYPKDEDPFDTRDRAKRKERYGDDWRFYMAAVKYESDSYRDAEYWLATRNDYGPLVEKESNVIDMQQRFKLNKKLRSANRSHLSKSNDNPRELLPRALIKRPAPSKPKTQLDGKRLKLGGAARSSSAVVNDANAEPGSSKTEQSIIIRDNQAMDCAQTEETADASKGEKSTEQRTRPHSTEQKGQALSLPVIEIESDDFTGPTEVITIDGEDLSHDVKQPDENNGIIQSHYSSNTAAASMSAAKPPTSAAQTSQSYLDNQQHFLQSVSSASNFEPRIENVRSIATTYNDHEHPINDVLNSEPPTSHHSLKSLKMSANLYSNMDGARRLVPIQKPIKKRLRLMNFARYMDIAAQNPSNLMEQTGTSSTRSVEQQPSVVPQNQSQNGLEVPEMLTGNSRHQTASLSSIALRSSTNASNPLYQTSELSERRQLQTNHQDSQRQPQRPKIRINISIKAKNKGQMPSLQGVTKKTPPPVVSHVLNAIRQSLTTTHNNYFLNKQQSQASLSAKPTENRHTGLITGPQNIAASLTRDIHNSEMPTGSLYQSPLIQHSSSHENMYQNQRTQKQLVNQSTGTNSKMGRFHINDDVAVPVFESHLNVMDNVCQTDECVVEEPLSPYYAVTVDSGVVTDHEVISDHEMSTDEAPVETSNNVNCTVSSSADRPAAQTSTSTNHQTHPRVILEQQMLENFATLFTQMGSTLRYTCDMFNNLRSSVLETAETYKQLLDAVEKFNMLGNTASNASPSSNVTPEISQATEERHTEVTARASSTNKDQHSNYVANEAPKKKHNNLWRFVLPIEYDPHDTKWTLKYRTNMPGLVELMPQSGIYVSYGELKYCQQVSKDCKSLAQRLLPEVFNREALSVCLSMTEQAQANEVGSNVRPGLDEHASKVLINFVLEHGLQCGWKTNLQPILSTLHAKIQEIRFKYGVMTKC